MTDWDKLSSKEAELRFEFLASLKTNPDLTRMREWLAILINYHNSISELISQDNIALEKSIFSLIIGQLDIDEPELDSQVDSYELSEIFRLMPKFRDYCEELVVAEGAWAQLKFPDPLHSAKGINLVNEALSIS